MLPVLPPNIGDILKLLKLQYRQKMKLEEVVVKATCPERLKDEIVFTMQEIPYDISHQAIRENLVYPVLKEGWKPYMDFLSVWSQITLQETEFHYIITRKSEYGKIVMDAPYLAAIEVNVENFKQGWREIIQKMYLLQQQNPDISTPIYGVVSNGETWELGKLEQNVYTKYTQRYDLGDIDKLFHAMCAVMALCKKQSQPPILSLDYTPQQLIG